jgi:hypothetical protein
MDHSRVMQSTVDRWQCRWEDTGAWWRARQSLAFGQSEAWELVGEGAKERGECGKNQLEPHRSSMTVWRPGNDDEAVVEGGLGGGGA